MNRKLSILAIAATLSVAGADFTWAQGRRPSPNRGLGQAAAGAAAHAASSQAANTATTQAVGPRTTNVPATANPGRSQVDKIMSRGNPPVGNMAAGWNRGQSGLRQSTGALSGGIASTRSLPQAAKTDGPWGLSPEQVRDQRIQRAEHLRAVSERNGNETLLETADRMESSALENYQRQSAVRAGLTEDENSDSSVTPIPAGPTEQNPGGKPKRGFWFRFR